MSTDYILRAVTDDKLEWLKSHPEMADIFIEGPRDAERNLPRLWSVIWEKPGDRDKLEAMPAAEGWFLPNGNEVLNLKNNQDLLCYLMSGLSGLDELPAGERDPIYFLNGDYFERFYVGGDESSCPACVFDKAETRRIWERLAPIAFGELLERYDEEQLEEQSLNFRGPMEREEYLSVIRTQFVDLKAFIENTVRDGKSLMLMIIV